MNIRCLTTSLVIAWLATASSAASAYVVVSFPTPGIQYVGANPGGSDTMRVRLTNAGTSTLTPASASAAFGPASSADVSFTSLDPAACPITQQQSLPAAGRLTVALPSLAAGATVECAIRVDRAAGALRDIAVQWPAPASNLTGPIVIIGERIAIAARADFISLTPNGAFRDLRFRLVVTNQGTTPIIGVGFSNCGFTELRASPQNPCPLIQLPETESLICPMGGPAYFASPPIGAGETATCEIIASRHESFAPGNGFGRDLMLTTPDGRTLFDAAQILANDGLRVPAGFPTLAVPGLRPTLFAVLAMLLVAFAWRRHISPSRR